MRLSRKKKRKVARKRLYFEMGARRFPLVRAAATQYRMRCGGFGREQRLRPEHAGNHSKQEWVEL